ncbi:bone morphogenetic protein 10-like [Cheilinus undulatus]|uniref:bone morphogenetic protein 10-like n=1 Tax=Cheilinus undulatus TaxID=241271 RepID=UPI001BD67ECB|nr:bone morphogenetic protein 10-like [Cheilinus undulatus]
MTALVLTTLGFICSLNALLLTLAGLSLSSPIRSLENHHRASVRRDMGGNPLLVAQDFLSQFLSTINMTEPRSQPGPRTNNKEPPDYMLELYNRFANDRTAVPSANIVRSFKNEDPSPYRITPRGVRIHPLLFNISMRYHEHITLAELRLFTLVHKARRPYAGIDCEVTIFKIHECTDWKQKVGKGGRRRDKEEVVETDDLEKLVTKHIHARDNSWVSFDLTHVVTLWRKSGCANHRLEVHITSLGSEVTEEGRGSVEIDIERNSAGKHNAVMIVFSDKTKAEFNQIIKHENEIPDDKAQSQQASRGNHNTHPANQEEMDKTSLMQLQSNLIYDTPPRIRRNVKSEPCKRTPLFVDFKDIGWDRWIIQPLSYEAYECNGVCSPPMTDEVSPTNHAIVQTLLSIKSPERASRACCVPTKLEPISLLYHDNGVITFNHKYEGMVVAECGCR